MKRRVHRLIPQTGHSALTASPMLAEQLGSATRAPGDLIAIRAADRRRRVVILPDLHHSAAPDAIEEWIGALARLEQVRSTIATREVSSTGCWLSLRQSWICTRLDGGMRIATP
ncbi:hypothetical protein ACFWU3_22485 [Streptomyces sp. NPDC058685]|uniref:hypothetical protein n=1 Tax=Streptomyces sp. NPDC058685 TaxID=3346598 RepID=UPI00364D9C2C